MLYSFLYKKLGYGDHLSFKHLRYLIQAIYGYLTKVSKIKNAFQRHFEDNYFVFQNTISRNALQLHSNTVSHTVRKITTFRNME